LVLRTGNPGISPAFGEMWEMKLFSRASSRVITHIRMKFANPTKSHSAVQRTWLKMFFDAG
jgi:hypothetical protein